MLLVTIEAGAGCGVGVGRAGTVCCCRISYLFGGEDYFCGDYF